MDLPDTSELEESIILNIRDYTYSPEEKIEGNEERKSREPVRPSQELYRELEKRFDRSNDRSVMLSANSPKTSYSEKASLYKMRNNSHKHIRPSELSNAIFSTDYLTNARQFMSPKTMSFFQKTAV